MTEPNKRVIQFGAIFILCAVIIYIFMSTDKPPSNNHVHADHEAIDSIKVILQKEVRELEVSLEKDPQNDRGA